jgi:hypothetical protein
MRAEGGQSHAAQPEAEFLRSYDPSGFPPFAVTVDLAVFTIRAGVLAVLLVQRTPPASSSTEDGEQLASRIRATQPRR